jgi:hypothetical protein
VPAREGTRCSNLYCMRGSRALEPQNRGRIASRWGNHYDQGHLHHLHRASETDVSQSWIEPGTSCTAGEHSIRMTLLTAIQNLGLYYYRFTNRTCPDFATLLCPIVRSTSAPSNFNILKSTRVQTTSIAGHRHRGRCRRHWYSGIQHISPVT